MHHAIRVCPKAKSSYDKKRAKRNGVLATKALAAKWSKAAYCVMKRQEPCSGPDEVGMGPGPCANAQGREVQIRMDDCTKEPPAFGWRTRYVARTNFAGAKQDDEIGPFREMDVTLQHSRQPKAEMPPDSQAERISARGESFCT